MRDVPVDPNFAAWGVSFKPDMFKVDARVLPQPMLQYGGGSVVDPGAGAWNLRSTRFYRPVPLKSMAVVCLVPKQDVDIPGPASLHAYLADQLRMLEVCGVPVEGPAKQPPVVYFDRRLSVEEHMRQAAEAARSKAGSCQMLMVLLPSKGKSMYQVTEEDEMSDSCHIGVPYKRGTAARGGGGMSHA